MTTTSDAESRFEMLRAHVWDKIPKHLVRRQVNPTFRRLVDEFDWQYSWLLLGPTGAGKSTACVHLVRRLLSEGRANGGKQFSMAKSIFWTRADAITHAGGNDELWAHQLLHRAEQAKLLIIDDLADASKTLLRVLQARYDNPDPRPMVVTSGALNARELQQRLQGEAVVRWILESGGVRKGVILGAIDNGKH